METQGDDAWWGPPQMRGRRWTGLDEEPSWATLARGEGQGLICAWEAHLGLGVRSARTTCREGPEVLRTTNLREAFPKGQPGRPGQVLCACSAGEGRAGQRVMRDLQRRRMAGPRDSGLL